MSTFASRLAVWQRRHGRSDLPWQGTRDPYRIWLSEVMLQQTQVATVIPYYGRFLQRFPTIRALAQASEDEVLRLWSGLGYYARGRNLHAAARAVNAAGCFPSTAGEIGKLPGVGRSTAAAIAAFAFGERAAILDGNVKRVLARYFGIEGWPGDKRVQDRLWSHAQALLPRRGVETYTQALMDLGATVCTSRAPRCEACPVTRDCQARKLGRTADIPAPRPHKALPRKAVIWLLLVDGHDILLEKRPAHGIWAGLWSFPEAPPGSLGRYLRSALGCEVSRRKPLQPLEHVLTHLRLSIQPLFCVAKRTGPALHGARRWVALHDVANAAVPAPVKVILERLPLR